MVVDKSHPEAGFVELEPLAVGAIDLVWVIIALVCILVSFGFWVIATILDDLFGSFSIFGFHPFGFVKGLLSAAMKKEWSWMEGQLHAFTSWLWSQVSVVWRFMYVAVVSIVGLWEQVLFNSRDSSNQVANLGNQTAATIAGLQAQLSAEAATLQAEDSALSAGLNFVVNHTIPDLQAQLDQLKAQGSTVDAATLAALEAQINAEIAGVQAQLQSVESSLSNTVANDVTSLTQQMAAQRNTLESEIANGVSTAESFATSLVGGLGVGTVVGTVTSLASRLSAVESEVTECLDPLCDTVTPQAQRLGNLGKWLQDLEDLGLAALFVALAAECITDPAAVATDVSTVVNDVGGAVVAGVRDLINV